MSAAFPCDAPNALRGKPLVSCQYVHVYRARVLVTTSEMGFLKQKLICLRRPSCKEKQKTIVRKKKEKRERNSLDMYG